MSYVDHVVRRGVSHPATINLIKKAVKEGPEVEMPKWGIAVVVATFAVFVVSLSALEYTLRYVVATLAMVETPSAAITVSPSEETVPKDVKEGLLETGPTITLVRQKPITSSIRATIRHLISQAGMLSRYRGLLSFIAYHVTFSFVANILQALTPRIPGRMVLIAGIAGAALAPMHAAWTHKVISTPAAKRFQLFQRIRPAIKSWKQLALPAAVNASACYVTAYLAQGWIMLLRLDRNQNDNFADYTGAEWASIILRSITVLVVIFVSALFIVLPARVTHIRVEASILPEDKDTIVPFDRTFAGKVVPRILGGTGAVGFLDAWKSFNWEARRRLIKLYVKIFAIVTVLFIVLAHVLAFEVWAIMGPAVGKLLANAKKDNFFLNGR